MTLYWLTLVLVLAIVLVVAGYLIAIALVLIKARSNVSKLADALEGIADEADPLEERIGAIGAALEDTAGSLSRVDEHLTGVATTCGL